MDEYEPLDYSILKYLFRSSFFLEPFLAKLGVGNMVLALA